MARAPWLFVTLHSSSSAGQPADLSRGLRPAQELNSQNEHLAYAKLAPQPRFHQFTAGVSEGSSNNPHVRHSAIRKPSVAKHNKPPLAHRCPETLCLLGSYGVRTTGAAFGPEIRPKIVDYQAPQTSQEIFKQFERVHFLALLLGFNHFDSFHVGVSGLCFSRWKRHVARLRSNMDLAPVLIITFRRIIFLGVENIPYVMHNGEGKQRNRACQGCMNIPSVGNPTAPPHFSAVANFRLLLGKSVAAQDELKVSTASKQINALRNS